MPDIDTVGTWEARTLVDRDGGRIGPIDAIYLDDQTSQPEWALVNTGLFGTKASFVPLAQATQAGDDIPGPLRQATGQRRPPDRPRWAPVGGRRAAAVAPLRPGLRPHHQEAPERPRHGGPGYVGPDDG
jgi:hypothetical protein